MRKAKWILLAEDDPPTAELTARALAPDTPSREIIVVHDGLDALDCLHRRGAFQSRPEDPPSLVLLDLKMLNVDGLEVLRQIRADAQLKHIPVVMFTSSSAAADVRRSYELGANAYVVKPAAFREFHKALRWVGQFWIVLNEASPGASPAAAQGDAGTPGGRASASVIAA